MVGTKFENHWTEHFHGQQDSRDVVPCIVNRLLKIGKEKHKPY